MDTMIDIILIPIYVAAVILADMILYGPQCWHAAYEATHFVLQRCIIRACHFSRACEGHL